MTESYRIQSDSLSEKCKKNEAGVTFVAHRVGGRTCALRFALRSNMAQTRVWQQSKTYQQHITRVGTKSPLWHRAELSANSIEYVRRGSACNGSVMSSAGRWEEWSARGLQSAEDLRKVLGCWARTWTEGLPLNGRSSQPPNITARRSVPDYTDLW